MKKPLNKKKLTAIVIIISVVLIIDITFTGFIKFGYNVVRCGGMPVAITPGGFAASNPTYDLPGHYTPGWSNTEYLCTEQEAIDRQIPKGLQTKFDEYKENR